MVKNCEHCGKGFPIWKTLTINGKRTKVCKSCASKLEKKKVKEKKEKLKAARKVKRERITEKKLDSLVSKVIRTIYGNKCCTCSSILEFSKLHNGHFVSRQFRATRFHPQNCASQCPNCNLYLQGAQYEFGKFINSFHGENTAEMIVELSKSKTVKIRQLERNELYKIYQDALEHKDLQKLINDYNNVIKWEPLQ